MKRLFKLPTILLAVAAVTVSCDDAAIEETLLSPFDNALSISFESEVSTRATDTAFESGDEISVTAYNSDGTTYASNVSYSYANSVFSGDSPIRYSSDDHTLSFRAVYPYVELPASNTVAFEVLYDQRSGSNYTLSDLMTSLASSTTSTTPRLTFNHLLTKVIINVTSEDIAMSDVTATIDVVTDVDYNVSTGGYIVGESSNTITMAESGADSYKAIIIPQDIAAGATFGKITVSGVEFDIVFENGKLFAAGCEYEFDLSIREGKLTFVSSTINDWDDGDDSSEGSDTFALSEVSSTTYPTSSKLWIITDEEVSSSSDFTGLTSALYAYRWATGERPMLSFPNLKSLPEKALYNCDNFESISLDVATYIGTNAFYDCDYLTLIEAPLVETVDTYAFSYCSALTSIDLSAASTIGSYAFRYCTSLASLELPAAATIGTYALQGCTSLMTLSLPAATSVGTYAFYNCTALTSLTLATNSELETFGDSNCNVFSGVDISQIDLTVGSSVDVCGNTLFAPTSSSLIGYGLFASITGGSQIEDTVSTSILDYSATNYPVYSNDWVIEDTEAPLANFVGLNEALTMAGLEGRKINLSFPNLERFPSTAFYIDKAASITSIASVSAPKATEVGIYAFYGSSALATISMDNIETIGEYAFYNSTSITSIDMPSVKTVGEYAFYNSSSITSISMLNAEFIDTYAFYGCSSLTDISLPNVTSIGNWTFMSCTSLPEVSLPEVSSFGYGVFAYCDNLKKVNLPKLTSLPSTSTSSLYGVFSVCKSLVEVSLPEVTNVGIYAFYACYSLAEISLPKVTSIDKYAFNSCSSLSEISLPKVISIASYVFDNSCSSLSEISLPEATSISAAFYGCSSLAKISIPKVTSLNGHAFYNCTSLTEISLPNATSIGSYAFSNCDALTTISLPAATSIGGGAFNDCSSLTTISLPAATSIDSYAFSYCNALTTISLPAATSLGGSAFSNCTRLQSVSVPSLSAIYDGTFTSCYMLLNLEIASNEGVELTCFGTYGSDLFDGIDISYMTLTTGEANKDMVSGNYFTAPAYVSSYVYTDQTYGPFKNIVVK